MFHHVPIKNLQEDFDFCCEISLKEYEMYHVVNRKNVDKEEFTKKLNLIM